MIRAHNFACATVALGDPVGFEPVSPFLSVKKRDAFYEHNVGQFDLGFIASFIREPVSTVQEIIGQILLRWGVWCVGCSDS